MMVARDGVELRRLSLFRTHTTSVSNNFKVAEGLPNTGKYEYDPTTVGDCRG